MTGQLKRELNPLWQHLAWSPDGKVVALTSNPLPDRLRSRILLIDVASGRLAPFGVSQDRLLTDVQWAPDGHGLYVVYSDRGTGFDRWQIGFFSLPGGEFSAVTRDANTYQGLSLSADGNTIATAQRKMFRSFFLLPAKGAIKKETVPSLADRSCFRQRDFGCRR